MAYFCISTGLRGCYLPDNAYVIRVATRRELKAAIESEARDYRDASFVGASKKAIAHVAAIAWRNRHKMRLADALPLAPSHCRGNYCHGIFIGTSDRAEYKAQGDSW